jgi:hypothetical protein
MVHNVLYTPARTILGFHMKGRQVVAFAGLLALIGLGTASCGVIPGTSVETIEPGYTGLRIQSEYPPHSGWLAVLCSLKGSN